MRRHMPGQRSLAVWQFTLLVVLGVGGGCGLFRSTEEPPWILGNSPQFSAEQFLLGVGEADSRSTAEERAYAAVAKIFQARIQSESRDWESYWMRESGGREASGHQLALEKVTRVTTDKVLENLQILDRWVQPGNGRHYVLAGIRRSQAERAFLDRIRDYDELVHTHYEQAQSNSHKLKRVGELKRAINTLILREAANVDLRVIRLSGEGVPSRYTVGELTQELEQFLEKHILIGVEVEGAQADAIRMAVMDGLHREGFRARAVSTRSTESPESPQEAKSPDLLVSGKGYLWTAELPDPLFTYVRWCGEFVLSELPSRRVVGVASRSGREGHVTEKEAMTRATERMQTVLSSELVKTLTSYVYGDVQDLPTDQPAVCSTTSEKAPPL